MFPCRVVWSSCGVWQLAVPLAGARCGSSPSTPRAMRDRQAQPAQSGGKPPQSKESATHMLTVKMLYLHINGIYNDNPMKRMTKLEWFLIVLIAGAALIICTRFIGPSRTGCGPMGGGRAVMQSLKVAIAIYELDTGHYPQHLQGLVEPDQSTNWRGPYLREAIPNDPWGRVFQYTIQSGNHYELRSLGSDGKAGTADDIIETNQQGVRN